ncbi:type VI secretion system baseplate subunit TssG, partial [Caballeronia sp.]|uniref:type VI secretion system baseplate subunit TssG n=1 Tax=Caballeronia sp. TaxID=1931223 RepID=UPI003C469A0E
MEAMGADERLPAVALIERLVAQPQGFDLFQAIHLLERAQPWARALGYGDGTDEAVRFKGFVSLSFEASDIRSVSRHPLAIDAADQKAASDAAPAPRETYTLTTPVMTLAGASGPLPLPFTEMVLARRTAREPAMADLLDIFNHRFLSFLYRSRQKHAPALNGRAPDDAALAACLDALGNLGLHGG